jgi:uncharacterized protein involved in response to NO
MSRSSLPMHDAPPVSPMVHPVLLAKGFRPFFLVGALFVGIALPVWSLVLSGRMGAPTYLDAVTWHAHEMVFGFGAAILAGFLLTAVGNWTQSETAVGGPLLGLVAAWGLGRFAMMASDLLPPAVVAGLDALFLPLLTITLARPIVRARNARNYPVIVALLALTMANVLVHLDALGVVAALRRRAMLVSVDVIVFFLVLVTGRVVAMFTKNATRAASCRNDPRLESMASIAAAAVLVVDALVVGPSLPRAVVLAVAAILVAARAFHWGARASLGEPMLWILHVGHGFLPLGLALRALAEISSRVPPSLGMHAITAGAIGSLCLGMMARVSLGHTGRAITAPRGIPLAFVAVVVAALVRMSAAVFPVGASLALLVGSALTLAIAFVVFAVTYARILVGPRADGKAG